MNRIRKWCAATLIAACLTAAAGASARDEWHHPLYVSGGGIWRARVRLEIANRADRAAAGEPVTVRIGRARGEADLAGARAEQVRVSDARGNEFLFAITDPNGEPLRKGRVEAGCTLTVPAECPPRGEATYYVYFANPSAWAVPDFLDARTGLRNGGLEKGAGEEPSGWTHDAPDAERRALWVPEGPRSGERCLKTVVAEGAEATWIATRQRGIHIAGGARYVMAAWVRADGVRGAAGWYIHVGGEANPMMINRVVDAGAGTYGWKEISFSFVAPEGATRADIGTVLYGTGTAWFDDVSLEREGGDEAPALSAEAFAPETLDAREIGEYDDPAAGEDAARWDCRAPVKVVNVSDRALAGATAHVDVARLRRGALAEGDLLVRDRGRTVPHCLVGDSLLFECEAPARTVRTYYVYARSGRRGARKAGDGATGLASDILSDQTYSERTRPSDSPGLAALTDGPANLVENPGFEDVDGRLPAEWPGGAEGEAPEGVEMGVSPGGAFGERSGKVVVPHGSRAAWTGWRQDVPVTPGRTYLYAAWISSRDLRGDARLHAHVRDRDGELCGQNPYLSAGPGVGGDSDWTLCSGMFTMPAGAAVFQVHLTMNATGTLRHDGVLVTEVAPAVLGTRQALGRALGRAKDRGLAVWPVNAVVKVFRDDLAPREAPPARITLARNEKEPLQLAVRSPRALEGVSVEVVPPSGARGGELGVEVGVVGFVPVDCPSSYYRADVAAWRRKVPPAGRGGTDGWAGMWPDPILPRSTFDLGADSTQPVWITVSASRRARPGDYRGTVRFRSGGEVLKDLPFAVRVWDFALPSVSHVAAIYDVRAGGQWNRPGMTGQELHEEMWRFMASNRLCPDRINVSPTFRHEGGRVTADFAAYDRAAARYFDELGLPFSYTPWQFYSFGWAHPPRDFLGEKPYKAGEDGSLEGVDRSALRPEYRRVYQAALKLYWDHMKAKGWADRIVLYVSDEPHYSHDHIRSQMEAVCAMIHEVDPAIPIFSSTWRHVPDWNGSLDVWGVGHYGCFPVDEMKARRAVGDRIWFTTDGQMCTDTPYCAVERLLPHYCFKYDGEAYEFWGATWLTYDPYDFGWHSFISQADSPGNYYHVRYPNGDGYLAYPGGPAGHDGIVTSVRLEQAREGVEDYEYLYLLRRLAAHARGREAEAAREALDAASRLVGIPNAGGRYSTRILPDPDAVLRVKELAATAIERLRRGGR